jgi:hypothetical protein
MINRGTIILLTIAFVAASIIGILYATKRIDTAQTLEIAALTTLVLITAWYAKQTTIMAKEMREQRYSECLPLLVPDVTRRSIVDQKLEPNEVDYQTLQTGVGIEVAWHNLGKGVAINTLFSFWGAPLDSHPGKVLYFPPPESTFLEIGRRKEIKIDKTWVGQWYDIPKAYHPRLEAEYQDIYERKVSTVQEFRIDEENGRKRAFLGELYFTVNGKRLGKEVIRHDS